MYPIGTDLTRKLPVSTALCEAVSVSSEAACISLILQHTDTPSTYDLK